MIIIKYKENTDIVEMFDTVKEFKEYIYDYLTEMEIGMNADSPLETKLLFGNTSIEDTHFEFALKMYLDANDELEILTK